MRSAAGLLATALLAAGCAGTTPEPDRPVYHRPPEPPPPPAGIRAVPEHGIEIVALRLSAAGRMLDLRYRVTDPDRAAPLLERTTKVSGVDQATGAVLSVPRSAKVGAMRQSSVLPQAGTVYFLFLGNTGGVVHPGSLVTVRFGAAEIRDLVVE